jgi:hypothetical protein
MSYYTKYIKYKNKYLQLQNQLGGEDEYIKTQYNGNDITPFSLYTGKILANQNFIPNLTLKSLIDEMRIEIGKIMDTICKTIPELAPFAKMFGGMMPTQQTQEPPQERIVIDEEFSFVQSPIKKLATTSKTNNKSK